MSDEYGTEMLPSWSVSGERSPTGVLSRWVGGRAREIAVLGGRGLLVEGTDEVGWAGGALRGCGTGIGPIMGGEARRSNRAFKHTG